MFSIEAQINNISKTQKLVSGNVVRDYFLGITASVANEINTSQERSQVKKPTIIGGIAIRKAHLTEYPRYTSDIDFEVSPDFYIKKNSSPLENYKKSLEEIADGVRQKIVSVYGSEHNYEPRVKKLREPVDDTGKKFGTLKGDICIPSFMKWKNINLNLETTTFHNTTFETQTIPVIHDFIDIDKLNLYPIEVQTVNNIFANKIYAFLQRLTVSEESSKISRIKDLFDIWYMKKNCKIDMKIVKKIFSKNMSNNKEKKYLLKEMEKIKEEPFKYFNGVFNIIGKYTNSVSKSSNDEKMKRMTKGLVSSFKFPKSKELIADYWYSLVSLDL